MLGSRKERLWNMCPPAWRAQSALGRVIMLNAVSDHMDRGSSPWNLGAADDYLNKPLIRRSFLARVQSGCCGENRPRERSCRPTGTRSETRPMMRFADWRLDVRPPRAALLADNTLVISRAANSIYCWPLAEHPPGGSWTRDQFDSGFRGAATSPWSPTTGASMSRWSRSFAYKASRKTPKESHLMIRTVRKRPAHFCADGEAADERMPWFSD